MTILMIQTGGTIDKDYPRTMRGHGFEISEPAAQRIIERVNPAFEYEIVTVAKKDSLELTDDDRARLRTACLSASADRIVITHGTDTMIQTATSLSDVKDKVIVITGAMRPERFSNSDASFNLGVAIGAAQALPNGVYVAMHGGVHRWDAAGRNATGQFIGI